MLREDEIVKHIRKKIEEFKFSIRGPESTEYGYGWSPTESFWKGNRRVHIYMHLEKVEMFTVLEIADELLGRAMRIEPVPSLEDAWKITHLFLIDQCSLSELMEYDWIEDTSDHNKFIPHPPSKHSKGNIVGLIDAMTDDE